MSKAKKGKAFTVDEACTQKWDQLSGRVGNSDINWYTCEVQQSTMVPYGEGSGGLSELVEHLNSDDNANKILFGLLKVQAVDDRGSTQSNRHKFIGFKFLGQAVPMMGKAKLNTNKGKIEAAFPVQHISCDLDGGDLADFNMEILVREFLRVGGAHKPNKYIFGPDQEFVPE